MIPPLESFWTLKSEIPSQEFIIKAKDNDTGMEWKIYESYCERGKINWFQMYPISGNITLTCTYLESDVERSLTYNYNPQHQEIDQNLNYYLSKEQISKFSKLNKEKINTYKNSKSVNFIVNQNYYQILNMNFPFMEKAELLLTYTGLNFSDSANTASDLNIIFNLKATTPYMKVHFTGDHHHDEIVAEGVRIYGTILFKSANKTFYAQDFIWEKMFKILYFDSKQVQLWSQITDGYRDLFNENSMLQEFGGMLINAFELDPIDFYLNASSDKNEVVACSAIKLLGELRDAQTYDPLINIYKSESGKKKKTALEALAEMKDPRALDFLIKVFEERSTNNEPAIVYVLFDALIEMQDSRALDIFVEGLGDESSNTRQLAAIALGKLGDQRGAEPLIVALDDKEYAVVKDVANALGKIKDKRAVMPLVLSIDKVNNNKNWKVYQRNDAANTIIEALGNLGDPIAIEYLIPFMKKNKFKTNKVLPIF